MRIRSEEPGDEAAVHSVNVAAFGRSAEADLVDTLRQTAQPLISLVAEIDGALVGHILFSPVSLAGHDARRIMGLGPLAVMPEHQRQGIGTALVRAGLRRWAALGGEAVVVVGDAEYYERFGFVPALRYALTCEYDVPEEAFMIVELQHGCLRDASGMIRYDEAFNSV